MLWSIDALMRKGVNVDSPDWIEDNDNDNE
jgi:hypothetical protein